MDNAYWNGKYMYYGNGLTYFKAPLQAAEDIATHEMTHGITQFTAGLEYFAQSGAINESMSDVFGALVDSTNWFKEFITIAASLILHFIKLLPIL